MKRLLKINLLIVFFILLASCASHRKISVIVKDEYVNKSFNSKDLVVCSFIDDIEVKDKIGTNPYKGKSEADLQTVFTEKIKKYTTFSSTRFESIDRSTFKKINLLFENEEVFYSIPTSSLNLENCDFVLFIENYEMTHVRQSEGVVWPLHKINYFIWDNNENVVVLNGAIEFSDLKFGFTVSHLIKIIFQNSPFKIVSTK